VIAGHKTIPLIVALVAITATGPAAASNHARRAIRTPAQSTWTTANLSALAQAYAALNPGWAPPSI